MRATSNVLGDALSPMGRFPSSYAPPTAQTSTPSASLFKPNTALNVAYGNSKMVPTGQYTNNTTALSGLMRSTPSTPKLPPAPNSGLVSTNSTVGGTSGTAGMNGTTGTGTSSTATGNAGTAGSAFSSPTAPTKGLLTFPGIESTLTDKATGGNTDAQGYTKQAADIGSNAANVSQQADTIARQFGQQYADVGKKAAAFEAGQLTTGTTPVAEGNAAVTERTKAAEQTALAQGEQAALQGLGYMNQGAQIGANAALGAAGAAYTGSQQELSALGTAAGLVTPTVAGYGQTVFNPLTGTYAGGGGLPPETMQQYAKMAANGQYSAIPAFITSNPVLSAQLNEAARAINPNYNPITSAAQGGVLAGIPALQSANTAADGIRNTITTYLQANPQLNPSGLAAGNILQQWIQGKQLADPKYQTLFNYLNEYTNTLAPILGVGGDPTNLKTQIAQGFVNAAASGQSISQVLEAMSGLARNKIADLQSGALGGGTSVPSTGNAGAGGNQWPGWNP